MSWITINETLCAARFSEDEWTAFTTAARANASTDVITTTIRQIVNRVRGYALACSKVRPAGAEGTVPPELEDAALALLLEQLCIRLPGSGVVLDEPRQKKIVRAVEELKAASKCELYCSPATGEDVSPNSPATDGGCYGGEDIIDFTSLR